MRASRPTIDRMVMAAPDGRLFVMVCRGGACPPVDVCAATNRADISGLRADLRSGWPPKRACGRSRIGPYRGLSYRKNRGFPVGRTPAPANKFDIPGNPPVLPPTKKPGKFLIPNSSFSPPSVLPQPRKKTLSLRPRVWYTIGVWAAARAAPKTKWRLPP